MKTLFLMRNAKANKDAPGPDEERPLSKRGLKDSLKMAEMLKEKALCPDYVLTSSARRTRETAYTMLLVASGELTIRSTRALYMAEAPDILRVVQQVGGDAGCLMIVGHNPGLESFLQYLTGQVESLPTAAIASLEVPVESWSALTLETVVEKYTVWRPKK